MLKYLLIFTLLLAISHASEDCDGKNCGEGIINVPCCSGYECVKPNVLIMGMPGTCKKIIAPETCDGKNCGGVQNVPCCPGYECDRPHVLIMGLTGICRKSSALIG